MFKTKTFLLLSFGYIVALLFLTVYSYSQIDLNLTLSSNVLYQSFQNQLIYLGYFNRPLSTLLFVLILLLLFTIYYLILKLVKQKKLTLQNICWLITLSIAILLFSYPSFSHDFFNYIFDARIVTKYHSNPYFFKALDFPDDLWIRFMHWIHRTYPYGPLWLLITLPFSFLGFEKFTLTLLNFKLMFILFHLGNIYLIYQILKKASPKHSLFGVSFYAFNPLILVESLVSPHNEVMMLFFLLLALYAGFIKQKFIASYVSLLLSAGVKFVTIVFLPIFVFFQKFKKDWDFKKKILIVLFILILPIIAEIFYREPYPWYFIPLVGISALLVEYKNIVFLIIGTTIGVLLRYAPYLYKGDYSAEVVTQQRFLFVLPIIIFSLWIIIKRGLNGIISCKE